MIRDDRIVPGTNRSGYEWNGSLGLFHIDPQYQNRSHVS